VRGDPWPVRALLACYPAGWRRRYGHEYAQLLCDLGVVRRPGVIFDSLRGAVRAHGGVLVSTRSPMTTAVWAGGLFTVAGIGFQKLTEDFARVGGGAYPVVIVAAAIALLALVAASTPTAVTLLRNRGAGVGKYLLVPVVGAAVWYGVLRVALTVADGHGVHSAANIAAFVLIAVAGIAVVAATAWAVSVVLHRLPAKQPARLRPTALVVLAAGMAVTTVSAVIWGLRVQADDPSRFHGNEGILATSFVPSWLGAVAMMVVATALAATAGWRQLAAAP
jgi:hypothetical protein